MNALAKLELIPVVASTDYLLVQNIEALLCECESIRFSGIDGLEAKQESAERHLAAIRLLQGELVHYEGRTSPAVVFAPFGSAKLSHQSIGSLI